MSVRTSLRLQYFHLYWSCLSAEVANSEGIIHSFLRGPAVVPFIDRIHSPLLQCVPLKVNISYRGMGLRGCGSLVFSYLRYYGYCIFYPSLIMIPSGQAIHVPQISMRIYGGISGDHPCGNFLKISLQRFREMKGNFLCRYFRLLSLWNPWGYFYVEISLVLPSKFQNAI